MAIDVTNLTQSIVSQFPAFAPFLNIPGVKDALSGQGITDQNWLIALLNSDWWRSNSDTQRKWQALQIADPAEAMRQQNAQAMNMLEQAASDGVALSLADAHNLAAEAISNGWDAGRISYEIASRAQYGQNTFGAISATQDSLQQVAAQQGLNLSGATTFDWAKRIAEGTATTQGFASYAQGSAAMLHPYWAKQIEDGATVRQLADPYIQQASKLLEISPDQVDLTDPKFAAFTNKQKDGSQIPMSQDQWAEKLMSDPQYGWNNTDNAKQAAYQVVNQLQQSFGAVK